MSSELLNAVLPVLASIAGIFIGHKISEWSRIKREKEELEKIRVLISRDFAQIYQLWRYMYDQHITIQNDLENFSKYALMNSENLKKAMERLKVNLDFQYWKTLENSASLLKLEPDEIPKIQSSHDRIHKISKNNMNAWLTLANRLDSLQNNPSNRNALIPIFKSEIALCLKVFISGHIGIKNAFDELDINWLDLNRLY